MSTASASERLFWMAEQVAPGARSNLAFSAARIDGPVDVGALSTAFDAVLGRHEALRTGYRLTGGTLTRHVDADVPAASLRLLPPGTDPAAATELLCAEGYDLAAGQVFRAGVAPTPDGADLFLAAHHIAIDGMAEELLVADLAAEYGRVLDDAPASPGVIPRQPLSDPVGADQTRRAAYWSEHLAGTPDLPSMGGELPQHRLYRDTLRERVVHCGPELTASARRCANEHAVSLFTVLCTAYGQALGALTGATDFCVGTSMSLRADAEIGCKVNMLPIRLRDPAAPGAIGRTWDSFTGGFAHALPFDEIVRACSPARGRRMPVFQALLTLLGWPRLVTHGGPARFRTVPVSARGPLAEIFLEVRDIGDGRLDGVLQAPAHGGWADRLDDLAAAYIATLIELCASTPER